MYLDLGFGSMIIQVIVEQFRFRSISRIGKEKSPFDF